MTRKFSLLLHQTKSKNSTCTNISQNGNSDMEILLAALLLLPSALSLPASSHTNTSATAPCVSHVPQNAVDADLMITIWNQTNCKGSAGTSYPFVYDRNSYQNSFFKSYTLSRTYYLHLFSPSSHCLCVLETCHESENIACYTSILKNLVIRSLISTTQC